MRNSWALMLITCVVCCIFLTACETQSTTDSQQMGTESAPQSESTEISEEDERQIQNEAELPKRKNRHQRQQRLFYQKTRKRQCPESLSHPRQVIC